MLETYKECTSIRLVMVACGAFHQRSVPVFTSQE